MSTETRSAEPEPGFSLGRLLSGVVGGVVGAILFGLLIELALPDLTVAIAIPSLYGLEGPLPLTAWGFHLYHGALLGIVYVIIVQFRPFSDWAHSNLGGLATAVGYGIALTVGVSLFVLIIRQGIIGAEGLFQLPTITGAVVVATIVGHILFAISVWLVYVSYVRRYDPRAGPENATT